MRYKYIIITLLLLSCTMPVENFFNGSFTQIKPQQSVDKLELEEFDFAMAGIDKFIVADTLIVTQNSSSMDFLISVYGLNSRKHIMNLIGKGHGHGEHMGVSISDSYFFEDDNLKFWISFDSEKKIALVNLSASLCSKTLEIEKEYDINRKKIGSVISWDYKRAVDSILYGVNMSKNGASFIKYDYAKDIITSEVELLNVEINGDISLVSGITYMNDDETKLVNMMLYFNQLNFYDYKSQKGASFSLADTPIDYLLFDNKQLGRHCYYSDIATVGENIIIAYSSTKESDYCDMIQIYNWNGELVNTMKIDFDFLYLMVDRRDNDIYLYGANEKIYKGSINKYIN